MTIDYAPLWKVIEGSPSLEELERRLNELPRDELVSAAAAFIDARAELVDALTTHGPSATEDTVDDLAGALVLEGPDAFQGYVEGTRPWPQRETWGGLPFPIRTFSKVVDARLGIYILDLWEHQV